MSDASDFFGGGSAIPVGGTIMVPYSATADGDTTNISVVSSYPEGFIKPQGQILLNADYVELRALLGSGRVFERTTNYNPDGAGILHGSLSYDDNLVYLVMPNVSGTVSHALRLVNLTTGVVGSAFISSPNRQESDSGSSSLWVTGNNLYCSHNWLFNDSSTRTNINPHGGTVANFLVSSFPEAGVITVTNWWCRVSHYAIGNTLHCILTYLDTDNIDYKKLAYKSVDGGVTWTVATYTPSPSTVNMVFGGRHDPAGSMAVLLAADGDVGTSHSLAGGSGSGGRICITQVQGGAVTDVDFIISTMTGTTGGTGTGYVVGDVVTFTGPGTQVSCTVDALNGSSINSLTVTAGGSGWTGDLGIFTTDSEGVFTLRQSLTPADGLMTTRNFNDTFTANESVIREAGGNWYCGTQTRLFRSTDKLTWVDVTIPANTNPSRLTVAPDGAVVLPRRDAVNYSEGYWSADGATWSVFNTWGLDTEVVLDDIESLVGEGTVSMVKVSGTLKVLEDLLDHTIEFQIPDVADPGAFGLGAGLYPLMRTR